MKYCIVEKQTSELYDHVVAGESGIDPREIEQQLPVSASKPFAWFVRTAEGVCYVRSIGEPERYQAGSRLYEPTVPRIAIVWMSLTELRDRFQCRAAQLDRLLGLPPESGPDRSGDVQRWTEDAGARPLVLFGTGTATMVARTDRHLPAGPLPLSGTLSSTAAAPRPRAAFPLARLVAAASVLLLGGLMLVMWTQLSGAIKALREQEEQQRNDSAEKDGGLIRMQNTLGDFKKSITALQSDLKNLHDSIENDEGKHAAERTLAELKPKVEKLIREVNELKSDSVESSPAPTGPPFPAGGNSKKPR